MQGGKDDLVPPENADFAQKMLTHATTPEHRSDPGDEPLPALDALCKSRR